MDITCGIYLYSIDMDRILVGHVTNHNAWSIPKGRVDDVDNHYFDCAKRELWEETNISLSDISVLSISELDFTYYKHGKNKLKSFLVMTDTLVDTLNIRCNSYFYEGNVNTPEFDDYRWVKVDDLYKYVHHTQYQNINQLKKLIY
jgi:8-oxo-dGTP pyrophosphatase MutT (NUDIX family)